MAPSVKRGTLDLGWGHDLEVSEFEPCMGLGTDGVEPVWDSLFFSDPPLLVLVSLKINKI